MSNLEVINIIIIIIIIITIIIIISSVWEMKGSTICTKYYGGGLYNSFEKAQEACNTDSNCAAIYDDICDNHYYQLCPMGYTEEVSSRGSCLHIKPAGTVVIKIINTNILIIIIVRFITQLIL